MASEDLLKLLKEQIDRQRSMMEAQEKRHREQLDVMMQLIRKFLNRMIPAGRVITDQLVFCQPFQKFMKELLEYKWTVILLKYYLTYCPALGKDTVLNMLYFVLSNPGKDVLIPKASWVLS